MSLSSLLDSIAARLGGHSAAAAFLPQLLKLGDLPNENGGNAEPDSLPVQAHWPAALASDPLGPFCAALADELRRGGHGWRQNPNYRAHPPSGTFLANYGYLECVGPDAAWRVTEFRLGFLLLGRKTLYPAHRHPAEEIYLPLGPARWFRQGEDWQEKAGGAVIHHPPHCGHATESGIAPLAAIYLWRGEVTKAAEIG